MLACTHGASRILPALAIVAMGVGQIPPSEAQMDITWVQPELGLVDVTVDDAAHIELIEAGQVLLRAPAGSPVRIMHPALADPARRAGVTMRGDDDETRYMVGDPPDRRYPPAWSLGAVWYQVFPDRFDNANPDNDPATFNPGWASNWSDVTVEELETARAIRRAEDRASNVARSPLSQVVYDRRYGGDLQGVVRRLDHIAGLGATAIYLNPVFEAHSLHKYDATDHRHIDPTLGAPSLEDAWTRRRDTRPGDVDVDARGPVRHRHAAAPGARPWSQGRLRWGLESRRQTPLGVCRCDEPRAGLGVRRLVSRPFCR